MVSRRMNKNEDVFCWLPVFLLPAGNLLTLFVAPVSFDLRSLLFSLIGAVAEELFFRWFLLKTILLPRIRPFFAIVLISIFFAAMHLLNLRNGTSFHDILPQMFYAFFFSIWANAVVWRKNSIQIPVFAHILLNATAVAEGPTIPLIAGILVLTNGILLMKGKNL